MFKSPAEREFDDAARNLNACRIQFENHQVMNVKRDPVEREHQAVEYEHALGKLLDAQRRMDAARVALYGSKSHPLA